MLLCQGISAVPQCKHRKSQPQTRQAQHVSTEHLTSVSLHLKQLKDYSVLCTINSKYHYNLSGLLCGEDRAKKLCLWLDSVF